MSVKRPSIERVRSIADKYGMDMSDDDLALYHGLLVEQCGVYDVLDGLKEELPVPKSARRPSYRHPSSAENPLNGWSIRTEIRSGAEGPLSGRTIALKDNICVSGIPMTGGASTMIDRDSGEGFVPSLNATIVDRILDAGATIAGKATCEYFCFSGGSHTSFSGVVRNPAADGRSAGGSSSGSAALVAAGAVDLAIGGDDGGSIRMPSSFCGTYGMKPTHGLVPCSGVMSMEATLDHIGPITASVADNALLLEVIAGSDGLDPRQHRLAEGAHSYRTALESGVQGLRIGVLGEGFGWPNSDPEVDRIVRAAADRLGALGADVADVSVPLHRDAFVVWIPIGVEGAIQRTLAENGHGSNWKGLYQTDLIEWQSQWRGRAGEFSEPLKLCVLMAEYFSSEYKGKFYAKAQNLSRSLTAAYDQAFERFDLLVMPTTPMVATPLPSEDAPIAEIIGRAFEPLTNTCPFDVTGHPAMSVPCGLTDGLPVGLQIVAKHFDEATIYRAARALERAADWRGVQ